MKSENRQRLEYLYGPEIIVTCCREWKTHFGDGKFGRCGICNTNPIITSLSWDPSDESIKDD